MKQYKILIGSPVCQKPEILKMFLRSLRDINYAGLSADYIFVDDNKEEASSLQLNQFKNEQSTETVSVTILAGNNRSHYVCDEDSHHWDDSLMFRVAEYKNAIIRHAIENDYDALFFVDSDLLLHPDLLLHLKRQKKEIISEIFWSQWHAGQPLEPNVWLFDEYDLVPKDLGETVSEGEQKDREKAFLESLKIPGVYEVGGLGACTLIQRSALLKGVTFAPIKNLTIHGEDRFFCIRAAVLGIGLFVDTKYPAYHIYRQSDLTGAVEYEERCRAYKIKNRITLSMVVRNEEGRYLRQVLESLVGHIDEAVIIDDASTDQTVALCEEILSGIPLHMIRNKESMFATEISLRKMQWEETIKTEPDWILNLDADELIEEEFWEGVQEIVNAPNLERCCFRLYDMWNATQYREDSFWHAHKTERTFLLRYRRNFTYQWRETPQHCGRFPANCNTFLKANAKYRIQHLGWATEDDRLKKYERYQKLDPDAIYGIHEQYESILDENPNLIDWK